MVGSLPWYAWGMLLLTVLATFATIGVASASSERRHLRAKRTAEEEECWEQKRREDIERLFVSFYGNRGGQNKWDS